MERQGGVKSELADSNDVLAQLGGGLHQHGGEDHHGGFGKASDEIWALGSVACSSTEALTLKDTNTLGDRVCLLHEVGDAGHDGGAVVAGPVAEDALHLAETEALASVAGSDESGVEAVGHVTPVCAKCRLASRGIDSLWANLGDEDPGLLLDRLGGGQPCQESSSCSVALVAGGGEAGRGEGEGGGDEQNLHGE